MRYTTTMLHPSSGYVDIPQLVSSVSPWLSTQLLEGVKCTLCMPHSLGCLASDDRQSIQRILHRGHGGRRLQVSLNRCFVSGICLLCCLLSGRLRCRRLLCDRPGSQR